MKYVLSLKYVYTFYSAGDIIDEDVFTDEIEVANAPIRFKLHDQEDTSFILSELLEDYTGKYVTITYPNKDILITHLDESIELTYDEYYSVMGDDNHNVYVGAATLTTV